MDFGWDVNNFATRLRDQIRLGSAIGDRRECDSIMVPGKNQTRHELAFTDTGIIFGEINMSMHSRECYFEFNRPLHIVAFFMAAIRFGLFIRLT